MVEEDFLIDFGTVPVTGYDSEEFTFISGNGISFHSAKQRAQLNHKATDEVHENNGVFLVLAPKVGSLETFTELDLIGIENVSKISFEFSVWDQSNVDKIKSNENSVLALEYFDGTNWVALKDTEGKDNVLEYLTVDTYTTVTFNVDVEIEGKIRVVYDAPSATTTGNTHSAIIIDNIIITNEYDQDDLIDVSYDLGYEVEGRVYVEKVVENRQAPTPVPVREGYEFLGWYEGDATEVYDASLVINKELTLVAKWDTLSLLTIDTEFVSGRIGWSGARDGFYTKDTTVRLSTKLDDVPLMKELVVKINGEVIDMSSGSYTLVMTEDALITTELVDKVYAEPHFILTLGENVTSDQTDLVVKENTEVTLTVTIPEGETLDKVLVNNVEVVLVESMYTFTMTETTVVEVVLVTEVAALEVVLTSDNQGNGFNATETGPIDSLRFNLENGLFTFDLVTTDQNGFGFYGDLRSYGDSALTISGVDGVTITGISLDMSRVSDSQITIGTETTLLSTQTSFKNLDITSFEISNGGTSQFRINSITITYTQA